MATVLHSIPAFLAAIAALALTARQPSKRPVRVCAGGDVSLGTNLDTSWARGRGHPALPDPAQLVAPLRPLFAEAQLALLNVEGAIGAGPAPRKCSRRSKLCYALRQPPGTELALRGVAERAAVVGNLANNHARDAGDGGFYETLRRLRAAGVFPTGQDTLGAAVAVGDGDTVAVLGFSPWSVAGVRDLIAVRRHVARAASRYGRVIVTMHAGAEGPGARHTPNRVERFAGEDRGNVVAFSHAAIDAGASLVIGHGPHVLRAAEWRGQSLIAYSLGNLVTYGPFNLKEASGRAAVLCATLLPDGRMSDAVLKSTRQRPPGLVEADDTHGGAADVAELSRTDFPRSGAIVARDGAISRAP